MYTYIHECIYVNKDCDHGLFSWIMYPNWISHGSYARCIYVYKYVFTHIAIKLSDDTPTNKICRRAPRVAHERDRIMNEIV